MASKFKLRASLYQMYRTCNDFDIVSTEFPHTNFKIGKLCDLEKFWPPLHREVGERHDRSKMLSPAGSILHHDNSPKASLLRALFLTHIEKDSVSSADDDNPQAMTWNNMEWKFWEVATKSSKHLYFLLVASFISLTLCTAPL